MIHLARFAVVALLLARFLPAGAYAQTYQPTDFVYEGYRDVRVNGSDTTWMRGLTHRYVNGELRFLALTHKGMLLEFRIAGTPLGSALPIESITGEWNLADTGALGDHTGIWFEQARNRLWITSSPDYSNVYAPARVALVQLAQTGAVSVVKRFTLDVPAKRVYGGCEKVPTALVASIGGPYVCGWGGYTSLVMQGGGASIGPTMYAIPDPDTIANGASNVSTRTILDTYTSRGYRVTIPINYFDNGDTRPNGWCDGCNGPQPSAPPAPGAGWQSPNASNLGWMVWGDTYANTGAWVGTTYVAVASVAGGHAWYCASTLCWDRREHELHTWSGSRLTGANHLARPDAMKVLNLPRAREDALRGPDAISGATYDAVTGRYYLISYSFGSATYAGRLYSFKVGVPSGTVPEDPQTVVPPPQGSGGASSPPASSCTSIRPGADWTCYNGNWLPPGMPIPGQSASTPKQPLLPSVPDLVGSLLPCLTIKPGVGWNCYNGNWLPPGMPIPKGSTSAPQAPSAPQPSAPTSSSGCTSVRPGLLWVCRSGNWLPLGHPDI